ncbi:MAG: hypothetical protein LW690_15975 [Opitutaceae bacterium]|nr:hypothetical protein [Opitutaceae bacterium]
MNFLREDDLVAQPHLEPRVARFRNRLHAVERRHRDGEPHSPVVWNPERSRRDAGVAPAVVDDDGLALFPDAQGEEVTAAGFAGDDQRVGARSGPVGHGDIDHQGVGQSRPRFVDPDRGQREEGRDRGGCPGGESPEEKVFHAMRLSGFAATVFRKPA